MSASLNIGKPFGVAINIHWSFWLIVLWAGSEGIRWSGGWRGALFAVSAILLFFCCVLLHELGHAWVADGFGLEVSGITLLPIGGMAKIRAMPEKGRQEFMIALAGPAVNVGVGLILLILFFLIWGPDLLAEFAEYPGTILPGVIGSIFGEASAISLMAFLIVTNFLLVIFNLIPAFPMDGGRIFRASLAMIMPYKRATRIAVRIGQGLALLTIFFTLTPLFGLQSLSTVFIAVLVFVGATYEDKLVQTRAHLTTIQAADVMSVASIVPITPAEHLGTIMERVLKSPQFDFPVMVQDALVGMLRRDDFLLALRQGQRHLPVSAVMRTDYPAVLPSDTLQIVQDHMLTSNFTTLPVLHNGMLVGLINIRDLNKISEFQEF